MGNHRIILAADGLTLEQTARITKAIGPRLYAIKVHDLLDQYGPIVIDRLKREGARRVWADLKLHDIPNTVGLRARRLIEDGADIITVHASGGIEMMQAAVRQAGVIDGQRERTGSGDGTRYEVYAVTVLTSLIEEDAHLTFGHSARAAALKLARDAQLAGVHGIVCSAHEVALLSQRPELAGLKFITPGVRSPGADAADQKRVDTHANAIKNGATHLVVGRKFTEASDPIAVLDQIETEIAAG